MSGERKIGPQRYLATSKPLMDRPHTEFFHCRECGNVIRVEPGEKRETGLSCCESRMERLAPRPAEELPDGSELRYDIVGGLNENCVRVFWSGKRPDWLYLQTFRGGQHIFLKENKRPPAVFALAGEDAYAYCDKDPCEMCSFRCKNGFVLYAWYGEMGLFSLEINQIASTQGSSESKTRMPRHNQ